MCPQICIKFKCSPRGQGKTERERGTKYQIIQYRAVLSRPVYAKPDWGTWNLLSDKLPRVGYWTTDLMVYRRPSSYGVLQSADKVKSCQQTKQNTWSQYLLVSVLYIFLIARGSINKCCAYWWNFPWEIQWVNIYKFDASPKINMLVMLLYLIHQWQIYEAQGGKAPMSHPRMGVVPFGTTDHCLTLDLFTYG